jgi:hypothetical protein
MLYCTRNNEIKEINTSTRALRAILRQNEANYFNFEVPKRGTNETRTVSAPTPLLKELQKHILDWLYENSTIAPEAHGFTPQKGNWSAASDIAIFIRKEKKITILTQDLRKAFDSVTQKQVREIFRGLGLTGFKLQYATNVTTQEGKLPMGAATSPHILNLHLKQIDEFLSKWAIKRGGIYRRYADDLTFAFPTWSKEVIRSTKRIMKKQFKKIGMELHPKKTKRVRLGLDSPSAEVIGLAVQQNLATRPKRLRNRLRGKIRQTRKYLAKGELELAEGTKKTAEGLAAYFSGEFTILRKTRQEYLKALRFRKT